MTKTKIKVGGKEYPFRVTMGALLRFKRETGHDVSQLKGDDLGEQLTLLWCCVASACDVDGVEFGLSVWEFADRLEPAESAELMGVIDSSGGTEEKKTMTQTEAGTSNN